MEKQYHSIVVIPALNPPEGLYAYVEELLGRGIPQVVVVNDGSAPEFAEGFERLGALEGCLVLTHPKNQGKGCALKTAYRYILGREDWVGYNGVITADADGQHAAKDVCAISRVLDRVTDRLVLGVRNLRADNVPTRSKIGNRITSYAFHLLYGARLEDTQTGLRGIPRGLLEWNAAVKGDRFEHEMNVLISAVRDGIAFYAVPIETIYFDNNAGTHLHTIRDPWRIFLILMSGLGRYTGMAAFSAVVDVASFWVCYRFLFAALPLALCYLWSVLISRGLSSLLNYTLNRRYVFGGGKLHWRTAVRYYCLWAGQMAASYGLLMAMSHILPGVPAVISKALIDMILAIGSYQIQLRWVFRHEEG